MNWLLFLLLCVIWGSSFIIMKHSKEQLTAAQIAALRIFSAGLVFIPFAIFHFPKIPRKKIAVVIASGITGNLIPAFLYATAIAKNIDSSLASILNSLTPILVVLIAVAIFHDRIGIQKIAGVVVGLAGLTLLFLFWKGISFENFAYASLILLATLSYAININVVGHFLKEVNPLHIATTSIALMTIPAGIVLWQQDFSGLSFEKPAVKWALIEASTLGVIATAFATTIFYTLIKRAGGVFASLVTYGIPLIAIFWGILDGEKVTIKQISCLAIILVGVYLANKPDKTESKTEIVLSTTFAEEST
jgi:drug/metabolite transporter (DMT)-like permease